MSLQELRETFPQLTNDLSDDHCNALASVLEARTFGTGECLTDFGEPNDTLYLVRRGKLSVHVDREGEDLLLGQAGPGSVVGEIGMIEPGPSSATLQVLEDASAFALTHERFESFAEEQPAPASALLRALSMELVQRLRRSSSDLVLRVDDHHWMRAQARQDHGSWLSRIAALVGGVAGGG